MLKKKTKKLKSQSDTIPLSFDWQNLPSLAILSVVKGEKQWKLLKTIIIFEDTLAKLCKVEDAYIPWHNNSISKNIA